MLTKEIKYIILLSLSKIKYGGIAQLARAIGSYPAGHKFKSYCRYHHFLKWLKATKKWPHRLAVRSPPFHGGNSSSNLLGVTNTSPT